MAKEAAAGGEKVAEAAAPAIVWNEKEGKFETDDGEAFLQYRLLQLSGSGSGSGPAAVMDMVHTYVPRSKRGMGLAGLLCDAAFGHAHRHHMRVIPTCSYISDTYLPRNPTWNSLVYKEEAKSSM